MESIKLTGLASGFDWNSFVDQMISIQRAPQNRLSTEKTINHGKLSGFGQFRSHLGGLQDAAKALSSDSLFAKRALSLSDEDLNWTATASDGAAEGDYTFDFTKMATRTVRTGASDVAKPLSATNDVSGLLLSELSMSAVVTAGSFAIHGETIDVAVDDTLQDVFDKISTATGGAVTATYDAGTDQVTLSSASSISLGSGADTSNFLYALKLYDNGGNSVSSSSALGSVSLLDSIAASGLQAALPGVDGEGNGSFAINGVEIAFSANDDSLQDVMTRVNSSEAGVTMSYDPVGDRFNLTNRKTGDLGLNVAETAGGLLEAMGLNTSATLTRGENAEFSINGGSTIVSASNTLDEAIHGVKGLTVTGTSISSQTISVEGDTSGVNEGIRDFIEAFNAVQSFIDDQTEVSRSDDGGVQSALFAGNREFTDIARRLRIAVFKQVDGISGSIRRLESIGIDFEGSSSQLAVKDEAKFAEALENNLDEVTALFTTPTTGLTGTLDSYLTEVTITGGLIDNQENSLERQNQSLDTQIADIERRLEAERTLLEESFIRMEQAQLQIQSQLSALQSTLNTG